MGRHEDLGAILIMLFLVGTFSFNLPIFISTMAVTVFHSDAGGFGLLSSMMAAGALSGANNSREEQRERATAWIGSRLGARSSTLVAVVRDPARHQHGG
ncbi:MAG TPA: hypothetical protein VGL22_01040 [Terracidiphilus sp.]